jgi:hypothetical protein
MRHRSGQARKCWGRDKNEIAIGSALLQFGSNLGIGPAYFLAVATGNGFGAVVYVNQIYMGGHDGRF